MDIPKIDPFWDEQLVSQAHAGHRHATAVAGNGSGSAHNPYERNLNFATVTVEDGDYGFPKKKTVRDPLSHRIIEKRRRDRMNNCLADLARLLPPSSLRKGRGRIEKTEIVELAIKHLRHLQCHPCPMGEKCEYSLAVDNPNNNAHNSSPTASSSSSISSGYQSSSEEQFRLGFQECLSEVMHFLVEQEGLYAGDTLCVRLVKHLNGHCENLLRDHWGTQGKVIPGFRRVAESGTDFKKTGCSGGSSSSGYHPNGSSSGSDGNGGNDGEGTESFAPPVQNATQNLSADSSRHFTSSSVLDYEAENSCSSTPLSIETSDVLSSDGKNNCRSTCKPPIPSIICSHSTSNNCGSPANGSNGRSSDDSLTSFAHRYKFKSNIKQRFTADCQTKPDDDTGKSVHGESEIDGGSDCEEVRDDGISDDAILQSTREEEMNLKSAQQCHPRRIAPLSDKPTQQISLGGASTPLNEKTAFASPLGNSVADVKSPSSSILSPAGLTTETEGRNCRRREAVEVKPSPEELLSAIQNLSNPNVPLVKNQSPFATVEGDSLLSDGKGVPAFALHEKGLFYVPLTIDKSIVSSYASRIDTGSSPPLYPVTISVCFLLNADKNDKFEDTNDSDVAVPLSDKTMPDFCQPSLSSPILLPLLPGGNIGSPSLVKSSRRGNREPNSYPVSRFSHPKQMGKESTHHNRVPPAGSNNNIAGYNHPILHSPSSGSSGNGFEGFSTSSGSNSSFHANSPAGGGPFLTNYPDGFTNSALGEIGRGGDSESHSGCGRGNTGGSSSGSSGNSGNSSRGRKRSVSSSPSISGSGGSLGYHSWHEKGSPNSHDFFNFDSSNTHNMQALAAAHGLTAHVATISQRHGQALSAFQAGNALREKEICFGNDKRSKKSRNVDQSGKAANR